jgi:transcriptional regulator with XRE-family HTH domain
VTRLEQLRIDRYLTPEELAGETGVPARTIRNLESGDVERPRIRTLRPLAEFFDVPPSELLGPSKPREAA